MSSPGASQALTRPDIRNAVVSEWDANGEAATFIADQVGKRIDVPFSAATLKRIPREVFTKDPNSVNRGPGGEYTETTFGDETYTIATKEQGHQVKIDENMAKQAATWYDAEVLAGNVVMSKLKRMHEIAVAAAVFNTTTFTGSSLTTAIGTSWTASPTTATPITDIRAARAKVRINCGRMPNSLVLSWTLWNAMIENTQVLNRINGGATADMPAHAKIAAIAELIEIDNIIIASGIKDSAKEGQNFSGTDIWAADKAMIAYINPAPKLTDINLCNVYNWEGDGGSWDYTFETFGETKTRSDWVRGRRQVGIKAEYPECGHLLTGLG